MAQVIPHDGFANPDTMHRLTKVAGEQANDIVVILQVDPAWAEVEVDIDSAVNAEADRIPAEMAQIMREFADEIEAEDSADRKFTMCSIGGGDKVVLWRN
jgi:hypothetical protein